MYALLISLLSLSPVSVPCGASIEAYVDGPVRLQLASGCTYAQSLKLESAEPIAIVGGEGTRIEGGISVRGARRVEISQLELVGDGAALDVRGVDALALDRVSLVGSIDGMHAHEVGDVAMAEVSIRAEGTGLWVQGARQVQMRSMNILAGEVALVVRDVPGDVGIHESITRVVPGIGPAGSYVSAEGKVDIVGNTMAYLGRMPLKKVAVIEIDGEGKVADNTFIGMELGVRARRSAMVMGCNTFDGPWAEVEGTHVRDCPLDLAPNALDWRARIGGRIGEDGALRPSEPPMDVSVRLP